MAGKLVAPLAGSVDRNRRGHQRGQPDRGSLPSRGAWIEIWQRQEPKLRRRVAPLAGSVDRNMKTLSEKRRMVGRSPRGERG